LEDVKIVPKEVRMFVSSSSTWYARFVLADIQRIAELTAWRDKLGVVGHIELAGRSWLEPDKIGSGTRIGNFSACALLNTPALYADEPNFEDALWFACRKLNPMLETFTTLFGIKNDIDIVVEHGLRPVNKLLHNIVQPRKKTYTKGWFDI
jgi:hypothetical protein